MRLRDIIDDDNTVQVVLPIDNGVDIGLSAHISWSVIMESIDPRPFLTPNVLVITTGMFMNVTDQRVWDAYIERLVQVPIAGLVFALGPAHRIVPPGLIAACKQHDMCLLTISEETPHGLIQRDIQHRLMLDRYQHIQHGTDIAQHYLQAVASNVSLYGCLNILATKIDRALALEDKSGNRYFQTEKPPTASSYKVFRLPGELGFRLVVEKKKESILDAATIRPITSAVGTHLRWCEQHEPASVELHMLVDCLLVGRDVEKLNQLVQAARFDPERRVIALLLRADLEHANMKIAALAVHSLLQERFAHVDMIRRDRTIIVLVQDDAAISDIQALLASLARGIPSLRISIVAPVLFDELAFLLPQLHAQSSSQWPAIAGGQGDCLDFSTLVQSLSTPGLQQLCFRLLQPIAQDQEMMDTLDSYLRNGGNITRVCEELFVHRNTLSKRLSRLEKQLNMDLKAGEVRATLLLALRATR